MQERKRQTKPSEKTPVWQKTQIANLIRYTPSGKLYARFRAGGKLVWKSLRTDKLTVAQLRLADLVKKSRESVARGVAITSGKMTLGDALDMLLARVHGDPSLKPKTKSNYDDRAKALRKTWPDIKTADVRKVTKADCAAWASKVGASASAIRFNQQLRLLRMAFEVAIESGATLENPAERVRFVKERQRQLVLPEPARFHDLVESVRNCGWSCAADSADIVQFLAFSGCRIGEARTILWSDCDFEKGEILVRGDAVTGTKNWTVRRVPMIEDMRTLLADIKSRRPGEPQHAGVLRFLDCRKALRNACARLGIPHISHHDLRHLFATRCIESGVDIPTVSRWLGHKDGGALAMRVYGHLRDQHSQSMARRVSFAATPKAENIVAMPKEEAAS